MPVLSGVGRGTSSISFKLKPPAARSSPYSSTVGKNHGATSAGSPPRAAPTARIAVAMAATLPWPPKLADEAAARTKRTGHAGNHQMGLAHPMERGIGEHRVELGDEIERVAVDLADVEPLHARHGEQLVAQIDAEDVRAERLDLGRERAVAAAEIEDALAGLGAKHAEYGTGKLLHEAAVLGVVGRRPALHRLRRRGIRRLVLRHLGCHGS